MALGRGEPTVLGARLLDLELLSYSFRKRRLAHGLPAPGPFRQGAGVWPLPRGPLTGAVQDQSQLQEHASKLEAGSAGRQAK